MSSGRHAVLATALLVLGGCTHANVLVLDPQPRPKTAVDSIQLLAREPERSYTVVGLVSAWVELGGVNHARRRLQKEAARLGGDALLFDSESLAATHKGPQLSARVIVFDRPPASKPPPPEGMPS